MLLTIILCSALVQPASVPGGNPFLDGSAAGRLQVQMIERFREVSTSPAPAPDAPEPRLGRIVMPDLPPGSTPDPLLPPECNASCRNRVKFARATMRFLVEIARGISR